MQGMKMKALAAGIALMFSGATFAADVPAGVALAKKQEIIWGVGTEVPTLDPTMTTDDSSSKIISDLFDGLVSEDTQGNLIPALATHWETSADGKTVTFYLRDGVQWSNGEPLTAYDVEYSFKRNADPASAAPYSWYLATANILNAAEVTDGKKDKDTLGVKALDAKTVQFTLTQPTPYFVIMLSHPSTFPVYRKAIEKYGDSWTRPEHMVSSGAYTLTNWVVNERIDLVRNPKYWNDAKTVINKASYLAIENDTAEYNRYRTGEIDITSTFPLEQYKQIKKDRPDELVTMPSLATYYYLFNLDQKPFDDVRVRKALAYAIDRDVVTKIILGQGQIPAFGVTPPAVAGFDAPNLPWANLTQKERNQKARELLKEAGYTKDNPLKFELVYNTNEAHKKLALAMMSMWKQSLPVEVDLANQEWKTFLQKLSQKDFSLARYAWVGDYNEASTFLSYFESKGMNYSDWANKAYDKAMSNALAAKTDAERKKYYQEAERIFSEDMPAIPVYFYTKTVIKSPKVGGYSTTNASAYRYTRDLYMMK
ncbi:peptide ABC transporter substrate-binding protein [Photobacterium sp. CCB-ST2H9]|uniref:peptide ABC transporter substrate-binding protein n=1 Tax=Photobacterium sp. CCB-ST2H9 TaxID=2912855 RepID=UPI0020039EC3|nr:peptide ABC transporter substrate-binding protein [Photobacterium sp. CCB-ST2H9]UTM58747.1 peptide ABC transporter substrate-binding protein [Photobacterium sp. CCB-ST2H9]